MSFNSRSLPPPTADEARRIDACKAYGCLLCAYDDRIDYHHFKSGNLRVGHRYGIALCRWHHVGFVPVDSNALSAILRHQRGPSLAEGSRTFHARYGSDQELLDRQDDLINWPRVVIPTKRRKPNSACQPSRKTVPRINTWQK